MTLTYDTNFTSAVDLLKPVGSRYEVLTNKNLKSCLIYIKNCIPVVLDSKGVRNLWKVLRDHVGD